MSPKQRANIEKRLNAAIRKGQKAMMAFYDAQLIFDECVDALKATPEIVVNIDRSADGNSEQLLPRGIGELRDFCC